ncbi:ATP-binding protein [Chitinophaga horti]|uniref:ATP-binding protein n=1 Tax=Chitinophaga horti TaxID=2920382 RepID=A0ABY6IZX1_9BACT|nr:ATP-binding protein [Chitinophaga horti]UYQ91539.1 ATP-binding protein [Chitinophaga horti]
MKKKVSVSDSGIQSSGLPKDYMEAVAEYIWNGFDAAATEVALIFDTNEIGSLNSLSIRDNGIGIDASSLEDTFGNFNDSIKRNTFQKSSSNVKGNKGRGRFSFVAFGGKAIWETVFFDKLSDKYLEYDITISRHSKDFYDPQNQKISASKLTGTTVTITDLFEVTGFSFQSEEFKSFLAREFGWFLLLNQEKQYQLTINSIPVDYSDLIIEKDVTVMSIKGSDGQENVFKVTFVRWKEKIGDKFYFYFLNSGQREVFKDLTSFNNNAIGFNHSIYVESRYFDKFNANDEQHSQNLFENNRQNGVFKTLMSALHNVVRRKQKEFVYGEAATKLIDTYERNGALPTFKNNKYDQARRIDLINVVKSLYCIEPKIFQGLNKEQQKVSIGLINILLDTDEREHIIELIGQIITLNSDERQQLLSVLRKTTVSRIANTVNLIEQRFKTIELLKALVFDMKKFTTERDHLQKAIEENYWILGEQYNMVSANEGFNKLLSAYNTFLEQDLKGSKNKVSSQEANRRPDIFLARKRAIDDVEDSQHLMEENLLVELKRPDVVIGKEQLRQIEDYLDIIRHDVSFNSQKRCWKFFIIGNKLDNYVHDQYLSQKEKGKKFLVKSVQNFEIYAYSWDDIFMMFDLRHKFLVDNLEFDKNVIRKELIEKGINIYAATTESANIIVHELTAGK